VKKVGPHNPFFIIVILVAPFISKGKGKIIKKIVLLLKLLLTNKNHISQS